MQGAGTQGTLNEHEVISLDSDDDDEGEKKGISKDDSRDDVEFVREVRRPVVLPPPPPLPPPSLLPLSPLPPLPSEPTLLFATLGVPQFRIDTPLTALGFRGVVPFRYGEHMPYPPPPPSFPGSDDSSSSEYDDEDDVVVLPNNSNSGSRGGKSSSSTEEEEEEDDDVVVVAARAGGANEAPQPKRARTAVQEEPPPSTSPLPRGAECVCPRTELADERCAVCLMPLDDADTLVRAVACHHMFCWRCIDAWLSRYKKVCPVCKGPLSKAALQRVRVVDSPAKQPRPPPPPPTSGTK